MSTKTGFKPDAVELIWARDRGRCARCGLGLARERRGETWAIHHREPRGRGGAGKRRTWVNLPSNGVCLCNGCHDWAEKNRSEALATGWLVSALGIRRPNQIPVLHVLHGYVQLADDGAWEIAA